MPVVVRKVARRAGAGARTGVAALTTAPRPPAPPTACPRRRRGCGCASSACGCRGGASTTTTIRGSQPGRGRLAVARAASAEPEPPGPAEAPPAGGPGGALELVNDLGVLAMRVGAAALTPHHGLDKLGNAAGFSEFVVAKHLAFLPFPLFWTYCAIGAQILAPFGLALGVKNFNLSRLCSASLFGCMFMAVWFHIDEKVRKLTGGGPQDSATGLTQTTEKGWEGFPLGVVEAHSYGYELAAMYALVFAYFTLAGPGKLALGSGDLADKK